MGERGRKGRVRDREGDGGGEGETERERELAEGLVESHAESD